LHGADAERGVQGLLRDRDVYAIEIIYQDA
jgi:hypothetical protein